MRGRVSKLLRQNLTTTAATAMALFALTMLSGGCPFAASTPDTGETPSDLAGDSAGQSAPTQAVELDVMIDGQGSVEQEVEGSFLVITAVADSGWHFLEWYGDVDSNANPLTVKPTESTSIGASFAQGLAPTDRDGDGVVDQQDLCDDSPTGEIVDRNGCVLAQLDSDDDGVGDDLDRCSETPKDAVVDAEGCAASERDSDGDLVPDDRDQCPDTPESASPNAFGCAQHQLDNDGDGVFNSVDQCPFSPEGKPVNDVGCPLPDSVCGNGAVETGELCDPPDGLICNSNCQLIMGNAPSNDTCSGATLLEDGDTAFSTNAALSEGAVEDQGCELLGSDIWFCYTASCDGFVTVDLCDVDFDSMVAIYSGCACPTDAPLDCNDDFCGGGGGSQVAFSAESGQSYLVRVGGWSSDQGEGTVTMQCNQCVLDPSGDVDLDGICGSVDNCPDNANPLQADRDDDGVGDVCDACPDDPDDDIDGDTICGDADNCPVDSNLNQADDDEDGIGNVCDNCEDVSNVSQVDADDDGLGDLCDNCPSDSNAAQGDTDSDGVGNSCDDCPSTPAGLAVDEEGCRIEPDSTPVAAFAVYPDPPFVGEEFTVDAGDSFDQPPGGQITSYLWDWGDDSPSGSGQLATHTYSQPNTYTITLTVGDAENPPNTDSASQTLVVTMRPTTWDSSQLLGELFAGFFHPESYDLDGDGRLSAAHVEINLPTIEYVWDGPASIEDADVPIGVRTKLYRVTNPFGTANATVDAYMTITTFTLEITGNAATWDFNYLYEVDSSWVPSTEKYYHAGKQTGEVSPDGTITWDTVEATLTECSALQPCGTPTSLADNPVWTPGVWTKVE